MLRLLCTKLSRLNNNKASIFTSHEWLPCFSDHSLRPISKMSHSTDSSAFTVTYLRSSCGLSQESAISASTKVHLETPEKPDSFLKLMRTHGLTDTHLRMIIEARPSLLVVDLEDKIRPNLEVFKSLGISGSGLGLMLVKSPAVLLCKVLEFVDFFRARGLSDEQIRAIAVKRPALCQLNSDKIFEPKLDFFKSIGLRDEDIARVLVSAPYILQVSLENKLVPCGQVLERALGAHSLRNVNVWRVVSRTNLVKLLEPNIVFLKSRGVPESLISMIFKTHPDVLLLNHDRFTEIVGKVARMGFDPRAGNFVQAIRALATMSKPVWDRKLEALRNCGFSMGQIDSMFKISPLVMLSSAKKMENTMAFLLNKLNMKPSDVCRMPVLFNLSLEKRIVPWCSVLQLLIENNVLVRKLNLSTYMRMSEKKFSENIVTKHQEALPDIIEAYRGRIVLQEFPDVSRLPKFKHPSELRLC